MFGSAVKKSSNALFSVGVAFENSADFEKKRARHMPKDSSSCLETPNQDEKNLPERLKQASTTQASYEMVQKRQLKHILDILYRFSYLSPTSSTFIIFLFHIGPTRVMSSITIKILFFLSIHNEMSS